MPPRLTQRHNRELAVATRGMFDKSHRSDSIPLEVHKDVAEMLESDIPGVTTNGTPELETRPQEEEQRETPPKEEEQEGPEAAQEEDQEEEEEEEEEEEDSESVRILGNFFEGHSLNSCKRTLKLSWNLLRVLWTFGKTFPSCFFLWTYRNTYCLV